MAQPSEPLPPQRLDRTITAYRIGDPEGKYPIFDATGSKLYPGRWNGAEAPVIYASETYSTALLEKLAGGNGMLPKNQHFIAVTLPRGASFETVTPDILPGWDSLEPAASRRFGTAWALAQRGISSAVLGFRNADQLEQILPALDLQMPAEHLHRLDQISPPPWRPVNPIRG